MLQVAKELPKGAIWDSGPGGWSSPGKSSPENSCGGRRPRNNAEVGPALKPYIAQPERPSRLEIRLVVPPDCYGRQIVTASLDESNAKTAAFAFQAWKWSCSADPQRYPQSPEFDFLYQAAQRDHA